MPRAMAHNGIPFFLTGFSKDIQKAISAYLLDVFLIPWRLSLIWTDLLHLWMEVALENALCENL